MYALIRNNEIVQVGALPAKWHDGTRDWDFRNGANAEYLTELGWLPMTTLPRPADTAATTHDLSYALIDGVPTTVWVERDKTQDELDAEQRRIDAEIRRQTEEAVLTATIALMEEAHDDGAAWVQPTGAHDAYALGVSVTHNDKTWDNITPANVWEPGVSGWRERVAEGPQPWVQPTGAHDAYDLGDVVTHSGSQWVSTVADNVWEPGVFGWSVQ